MKSDLLFELGTEELPPKALITLSHALAEELTSCFNESNLSFDHIETFATPRRLALLVTALDVSAPDKNLVSWGPPTKVAFGENKSPTKAGEAFAKKHNIATSELLNNIEHDGHQEKLCYRSTQKGELTRDLLGNMLNESLRKLPIPKRMRWGNSKEEFVRPVQWAVLLFNNEVCSENILGLCASNISQGHRFHGSGDIVIESPLSYEPQMRDNFVIANINERRDIIQAGVSQLASDINGVAVLDLALIDEVAALNEWPVPLLGKFDKAFLSIPPEALISSMKEHQKYFHIVDKAGHLMPAFITVANISSKDPQKVIEGNERVIRPRLADAAFFYKNDAKISRLGAINLAAIDEFKNQSERKDYLDLQMNDLSEALETLESAIRKIDGETRAKFKQTFDETNKGLSTLFPRLFGGGSAYLELDGNDLLRSGVVVMAKPPGKRISNIHLLSGGEKALSAVALIFSIFQLNPSPFCMLDEVDAPLDEVNVGRFCDIVKEMSNKVQFILITHNKTTMESMNQLNGITMSEPGVSRLVSVDVQEAMKIVNI